MATTTELQEQQTSSTKLTPYQVQTFNPATSQDERINSYYDEYINSQKQQEQAAYDENVRALDYKASKIAPQYKQQREALAAENEIAQQNFRQSALSHGINVGAGSQYALSSQNNYQRNMTSLRRSEAEAMNDVEENRRQIQASYQAAVAQAVSNGNLNRAKALYDEAVRVDESIVATQRAQAQENYNAWQSAYTVNRAEAEDAQNDYNRKLDKAETLAKYGDFSGYLDLGYTQSQVNAMRALWWQQMYGSGGSSGGGGGRSSGRSSSGSSSSGSGSAGSASALSLAAGAALAKASSGTGSVNTVARKLTGSSSGGTTVNSNGHSHLSGKF